MSRKTDSSNLHIVCVTGGRNYLDAQHVYDVLNQLHRERPIDVLGHGGCSGADKLAGNWAAEACVQIAVFPVLPKQWALVGPKAGPARNSLMLTVCSPDPLVVFPGGRGTNGCHDLAVSMGIRIQDERGKQWDVK